MTPPVERRSWRQCQRLGGLLTGAATTREDDFSDKKPQDTVGIKPPSVLQLYCGFHCALDLAKCGAPHFAPIPTSYVVGTFSWNLERRLSAFFRHHTEEVDT